MKPVTKIVGTASLPKSIQTLSSLPKINYGDIFSISPSVEATPELWMRKILGDTPNLTQHFLWSGLLGFPLIRSKSSETIAGWRISSKGTNWIRIENHSWLFHANLILHKIEDQVSFVSLMSYRNWFAHIWWPPLSSLHRAIVPRMLRSSEKRMIAAQKHV
jgi:hypothetical protein